jgi:hypothetical protein
VTPQHHDDGCIWRPLFESCHPPELVEGATPICPETSAPTFSPIHTQALDLPDTIEPTATPPHAPTATPGGGSGLFRYLYIREQEDVISNTIDNDDEFEDESVFSPAKPPTTSEETKKL